MVLPQHIRRFFLTLLTLALFCSLTQAGGDEWKPLDAADLAGKTPVVEKDADAEILLWEVRVDDTNSDVSLKHYRRIKIFTDKGREQYSKVEIEYLKGKKIKDVAARVIKPDGTITEIPKTEIFERTLAKLGGLKIKSQSFAAPGLEPGAILEYRYREVIEDGSANMRLRFQDTVPIRSISYYIKPYSKNSQMKTTNFNLPDDFDFTKDDKGVFRASMTNVPAFRREPFMPPDDDVRAWASLFYVDFGNFIPDLYWAFRATAIGNAFKDAVKPNDEVKRMAKEITSAAKTPEEQLTQIYRFCQTQIRNTNFDTSLTDADREKLKDNKSPGDTLKRRSGSGANIDQLFAALAKALGFDTRIALTGDRSEKFFNRSMVGPYLHVSSIAVKVGNKWRFFNPGLLYVPEGMLVWYEEGQEALLADENGYVWSRMPISAPDKSKTKRAGKFRLLEDGALEGEVAMEFTGHEAFARKNINDEDSPEKRAESLREEVKKRISAAELSDIKVENAQVPEKPFIYSFKVRVPGYAQKTGKRMFFQPNFFEYGTTPIFTSGERKHDVYFTFPWAEEDDITIELPAGYALENAESPGAAGAADLAEDKVAMSVTKDGRTLIYRRNFFFGNDKGLLIIKARQYQALKNFFEGINQVDTHSLTLKQTASAK
jgi:hypothetical protein